MRFDSKTYERAHGQRDGRDGEKRLVRLAGEKEGKRENDRAVADKIANLKNGVLPSHGESSFAGLGVLQRKGVPHADLDMISERVDKRGEDILEGRVRYADFDALLRFLSQHPHAIIDRCDDCAVAKMTISNEGAKAARFREIGIAAAVVSNLEGVSLLELRLPVAIGTGISGIEQPLRRKLPVEADFPDVAVIGAKGFLVSCQTGIIGSLVSAVFAVNICIAHAIALALVKEANGKGTHEEEACQREDSKHDELQDDAATKSVCQAGKYRSDGETDDEKITSRKLQNQANYSHYGPYLPKMHC